MELGLLVAKRRADIYTYAPAVEPWDVASQGSDAMTSEDGKSVKREDVAGDDVVIDGIIVAKFW